MSPSTRSNLLPVSMALLLLTGGCDNPKPPRDPADTTAHGRVEARASTAARPAADKPNDADVEVDRRVVELCDIPTAYFSFDAAKLSPEAHSALDALATCFIDGNGKGHGLNFVGHADPRGLSDYNFALGQRRAGAVASYVIARGVADERVESSSRGELDAIGSDESTWRKDRRVEILLAE